MAKQIFKKNCIGFRTSFLAKKQCAPPKAGLPSEPRIHWRKRAKQRGRCFATPTPYFFQNHLVRLRCSRVESNHDLKLRKLEFYPLNYESMNSQQIYLTKNGNLKL